MKESILQEFENHFGDAPDFVIRSPGRVNLIGEHTDYNDGFVLPMSIDRSIWLAVKRRNDQKVILQSVDFEEGVDFSLDDLKHDESWGKYVSGVAWALQQAGYETRGWEGILLSHIPIGAGLSSSAALEMAVAKAFSIIGDWPFDSKEMAKIGQRAENEWVGAKTGIMDQTIVASGQCGYALLLDCRYLSTQYVPMPDHVSIVIMDSSTRHTHTDSGYNERREQCETAAQYFSVSHLRDVTIEEFTQQSDELEELPRRRARHVITENERVLQAVAALSEGDVTAMGLLMNESHASMRDDFEITTNELDTLADLAQAKNGCFGARMTGGGFGGCVIALVRGEGIDEFMVSVRKEYEEATGLVPNVFKVQPSKGVELV